MNGAQALRVALVCAAGSGLASGARAQVSAGDRARNVAVNGIIGATRAALDAHRTHRSVPTAAGLGFIGGATVSGGKQLAGANRGPSPFAGRLLAAAGNSLTLSAGGEQPTLALQAGPLLITSVKAPSDSSASRRWRWRARLNLVQLAYLGYFATSGQYRFDAGMSARLGAPVLRKRSGLAPGLAKDGGGSLGFVRLGTVLLADSSWFQNDSEHDLVAHESVHVLQEDQFNLLLSLPAERALFKPPTRAGWFGRHFDLGVLAPLVVTGLEVMTQYERRPWEQEAVRLSTGRW